MHNVIFAASKLVHHDLTDLNWIIAHPQQQCATAKTGRFHASTNETQQRTRNQGIYRTASKTGKQGKKRAPTHKPHTTERGDSEPVEIMTTQNKESRNEASSAGKTGQAAKKNCEQNQCFPKQQHAAEKTH
jgi:hypothetical protein